MLPPYIIDEIRKREEERQEERPQPRVDLPLPEAPPRVVKNDNDSGDRGLVVIDLM